MSSTTSSITHTTNHRRSVSIPSNYEGSPSPSSTPLILSPTHVKNHSQKNKPESKLFNERLLEIPPYPLSPGMIRTLADSVIEFLQDHNHSVRIGETEKLSVENNNQTYIKLSSDFMERLKSISDQKPKTFYSILTSKINVFGEYGNNETAYAEQLFSYFFSDIIPSKDIRHEGHIQSVYYLRKHLLSNISHESRNLISILPEIICTPSSLDNVKKFLQDNTIEGFNDFCKFLKDFTRNSDLELKCEIYELLCTTAKDEFLPKDDVINEIFFLKEMEQLIRSNPEYQIVPLQIEFLALQKTIAPPQIQTPKRAHSVSKLTEDSSENKEESKEEEKAPLIEKNSDENLKKLLKNNDKSQKKHLDMIESLRVAIATLENGITNTDLKEKLNFNRNMIKSEVIDSIHFPDKKSPLVITPPLSQTTITTGTYAVHVSLNTKYYYPQQDWSQSFIKTSFKVKVGNTSFYSNVYDLQSLRTDLAIRESNHENTWKASLYLFNMLKQYAELNPEPQDDSERKNFKEKRIVLVDVLFHNDDKKSYEVNYQHQNNIREALARNTGGSLSFRAAEWEKNVILEPNSKENLESIEKIIKSMGYLEGKAIEYLTISINTKNSKHHERNSDALESLRSLFSKPAPQPPSELNERQYQENKLVLKDIFNYENIFSEFKAMSANPKSYMSENSFPFLEVISKLCAHFKYALSYGSHNKDISTAFSTYSFAFNSALVRRLVISRVELNPSFNHQGFSINPGEGYTAELAAKSFNTIGVMTTKNNPPMKNLKDYAPTFLKKLNEIRKQEKKALENTKKSDYWLKSIEKKSEPSS